MSQIWRPWPNYINEIPTEPVNYNWDVADDAPTVMMAAMLYETIHDELETEFPEL